MDPKLFSAWLDWRQWPGAGLPEEAQWKGALKAWLDFGQKLAEERQEAQWHWAKTWQQRAGAESLLDFYRQCDEVCNEFARQGLLWHLEWNATLRQQSGELLKSLLQSRGEGDALLALHAATQSGRQAWDAKAESLQQTLSELSPALAQSLQQWLTPPPEAAPAA